MHIETLKQPKLNRRGAWFFALLAALAICCYGFSAVSSWPSPTEGVKREYIAAILLPENQYTAAEMEMPAENRESVFERRCRKFYCLSALYGRSAIQATIVAIMLAMTGVLSFFAVRPFLSSIAKSLPSFWINFTLQLSLICGVSLGLIAGACAYSSDKSLKHTTILPAHLGMKGQKHSSHRCGEFQPIDMKTVTLLTRPGENNCVAIAVDGQLSVYLNPVDQFDYGDIPVLERLTEAQACQLWGGSPGLVKNNQRTFLLKSKAGDNVYIDANFIKRKLVQYKVRSSLFKNAKWINLKWSKIRIPVGCPPPDNE